LKEILAKLGLTGLRFGKEKNNNNNNNLPAAQAKNNDKNSAEKISINNKNNGIIREERKSNLGLSNNGRRLNKVALFQE